MDLLVGGVIVVGVLVADRLGVFVGSDVFVEPASCVQTMRFAGQREPPLAEAFFQESLLEPGQIAYPSDTDVVQVLFHDLAYTRNLAHVEWSKEVCLYTAGDPEDAVRLGLVGRNLCNQPRSPNADRAVEGRRRLHLF